MVILTTQHLRTCENMNCKSLILILILPFLYWHGAVAQVSIVNGDGTPLTTNWCNEDTLHPLEGRPAGGTFSGCGVVELNGSWYFNPQLASENAPLFPHTCSLAYTPPASTGYSRIYRTMRVQAPILIDAGAAEQVICRHGHFELPVSSVYLAAYRYEWSPGSFLIDSTRNPARGQIQLHDSQTFYLTVRDVNSGCMAYDTVTLYDKSVFATVIGDVPDSICTGGLLTLDAQHYDNYAYRWFTGEGEILTGISFEYMYKTPGEHTMMLVVQDSFCSDTSAHKIVVEDFILELTSDQTHFNNRLDPLTLTSSGSPAPYYITAWHPAHLFPDQSAWQQIIPADSSRTYTIIGETPLGCTDTASVSVSVTPAIHIPSSFTPNSDGKNDVFRIASYGDIINVLRFDIFDRWGKKVWEGRSNTNSLSWDGTYNGAPAGIGTYYYVIEAENLQGERFSQKGDVTLIR